MDPFNQSVVHKGSLRLNQVHLGSLWFTMVHLGTLWCTWVHFRSLALTWVNFGLLGLTWVDLGSLEFTWVQLGSLGCTWVHLGTLGYTLCSWVHFGALWCTSVLFARSWRLDSKCPQFQQASVGGGFPNANVKYFCEDLYKMCQSWFVYSVWHFFLYNIDISFFTILLIFS